MLELDGSFDEAELGFGKFSRFLRQAHDHEVVTLHKQEGGNYQVSLGRAPGREDEESQEAGTPETESIQERPSDESRMVVAEPVPPTGLGPRRGSTRRRREEPALALFTEGQAVGVVPSESDPSPSREPAGGARSGTAAPASWPGPDQLGLPVDGAAQIRYLTNSYRGVGSKTAEALVEAFGADLFSVLLNSPERLASVVPGNRAEQVLEGWKADYDRRIARIEGGPTAPLGSEPAAEPSEEDHDGPRRRTRRGGRRGGRDRAS
jgi:hypothetical protein